jgi:hypothetical protein
MKRNITLAIDDNLLRDVRKIALDRDTTLMGLVREYLEKSWLRRMRQVMRSGGRENG